MQGSNVVHEINNIYNDIWKYYMDEKTPTISLFDNSEKRVQIFLEFSQQSYWKLHVCVGNVSLKKTISVNPNLRFKLK